MSTLRDRLKAFISSKGISVQAFEKEVGLSNGAVSNMGDSTRQSTLDRISNVFPDLDMVWLRTGFSQGRRNDEGRLPLVPSAAIGGALSGTDESFMEYEAETYIIPAFRKSDFLIRVEGDSMEPRYYRGDIVACTRVPLNDIWFQWGKVYVVDTRQGALIKHIQPGKDDSHITLVSENQSYPPFQLHKRELNGVALVNGLIRVE